MAFVSSLIHLFTVIQGLIFPLSFLLVNAIILIFEGKKSRYL